MFPCVRATVQVPLAIDDDGVVVMMVVVVVQGNTHNPAPQHPVSPM
jgi:hypothetical protein